MIRMNAKQSRRVSTISAACLGLVGLALLGGCKGGMRSEQMDLALKQAAKGPYEGTYGSYDAYAESDWQPLGGGDSVGRALFTTRAAVLARGQTPGNGPTFATVPTE